MLENLLIRFFVLVVIVLNIGCVLVGDFVIMFRMFEVVVCCFRVLCVLLKSLVFLIVIVVWFVKFCCRVSLFVVNGLVWL